MSSENLGPTWQEQLLPPAIVIFLFGVIIGIKVYIGNTQKDGVDQSKSRSSLADPLEDSAESSPETINPQSIGPEIMSWSPYIMGVNPNGTVSATVSGQNYNCIMFNSPDSDHFQSDMPVVETWYTGKLILKNSLSYPDLVIQGDEVRDGKDVDFSLLGTGSLACNRDSSQ